jgi:hypothetical protein
MRPSKDKHSLPRVQDTKILTTKSQPTSASQSSTVIQGAHHPLYQAQLIEKSTVPLHTAAIHLEPRPVLVLRETFPTGCKSFAKYFQPQSVMRSVLMRLNHLANRSDILQLPFIRPRGGRTVHAILNELKGLIRWGKLGGMDYSRQNSTKECNDEHASISLILVRHIKTPFSASNKPLSTPTMTHVHFYARSPSALIFQSLPRSISSYDASNS